MPSNKTKTDRLHDLMPSALNTKQNTNWSGLIDAIGSEDQLTADLIEEVRKQFFVKTASRPYIDVLANNNKLSRPRLVGMNDATFRRYIPILSYQPQQVKIILNSLLDIFFAKENTTAYITSTVAEPFTLEDGWELKYTVDGLYDEQIIFESNDFTNIAAASAEEIAGVINKKGNYSFAKAFFDNVKDQTFVRIFSKTTGSRGSILVDGGRSLIALQLDGFLSETGTEADTEYTVTKIGDELTWTWTGGGDPDINLLKTGDLAIINLSGNEGSFLLESVDIANNKFIFRNLLGTAGVFTQTTSNDVKFFRPQKITISDNPVKAAIWEVNPNEINAEFPATPNVTRKLIGGAHINGTTSIMTSRLSNTSMTLQDASMFTDTGTFKLQEVNEIKTRILTDSENVVVSIPTNTRLNGIEDVLYSYGGKSGNTLTSISPDLPALSSLNEYAVSSLSRDGSVATVVTAAINGYELGEYAVISGASDSSFNGSWQISNIVDDYTFEFETSLSSASATGATVRVERIGMANSGSLVILNNSKLNTGIIGPNLFDVNAPFVLSSLTATISSSIQAGKIVPILAVSSNDITNSPGFLIFDYGLSNQEGPVPYLYKPNSTSIALDPAYTFKFDHDVNSSVIMLRKKGGITLSMQGKQYQPYITDPSIARITLEKLMLDVKAAGIFIDFLIKYPEQLYGVLDTYNREASLE